jgi:phage terminase large subunit
MRLTIKQTLALDILEDAVTTELLYGGGAGGGKSALGTYWVLKNCLKYAGSRGLIGRAKLKNLKDTTLLTLFEVMGKQGLTTAHYKYNEQAGTVSFYNGSIIFLKDLFQYPSDKNFDSLGSMEITFAFIDECNQVVQKAWGIVKSRIRYRLSYYCHKCGRPNQPAGEHTGNQVLTYDANGEANQWQCRGCNAVTRGLMPKVLGSCNPAKNWVYATFYKPSKDGSLKPYRRFVQSLLSDNKYTPASYRETLLTLDMASIERLLRGNWEYDGDPATLIGYDRICDLFTNNFVETGQPAITADVARFGADKAVIGLWLGFRLVNVVTMDKSSIPELVAVIRGLATTHKVPMSRIVIDEDGVGGGVVDALPGSIGFINQAKAMPSPEEIEKARKEGRNPKPENYESLKAQCHFLLAGCINAAGMFISEAATTAEQREAIMEELSVIKQRDMDKDGPLRILSKDDVKELIGRSPDYSDMMAMRMRLELQPPPPKPITQFQSFKAI